MKKLVTENFAVMFKSLCFGLLMTLSLFSLAQENPTDSNELVAVETEQVNINNADAATIARVLDGIGETRAQAIVTWREEYGAFTAMEDLLMVNGVGEVTVRNNASRIKFD